MRSVKKEFPNPVLAIGRDDYIEQCRFYTTIKDEDISVDTDNINIPVVYTLECQGLTKHIEDGNATVVIQAKSSAASFSRLYRFDASSSSLTVSIPKFEVVSKIELVGSVIATKSIEKFSCLGEFNELYFGQSTFEIRKGDILATEDGRTIFVDDSELERPIASIFDISRSDEQDSFVVPVYDGEKIEIRLKSELYELYYKFKDFNNGTLRRYATGVIVYPVLAEALTYVLDYYHDGEAGNTYCEKRWFRAIVHKVEAKGINLENYQEAPVTLANDLLGNIALDALKSFKDTMDSEMNSGETQMIGGVD